jgi:hypothetical protein
MFINHRASSDNVSPSSHHTQNSQQPATTSNSKTSSTQAQSSPASPTPAATKDAPAITAACKSFTPAIAKEVLSGNATSTTPSDTTALQASNTQLSSCAYTADSNTLQLTIRDAQGSLGTSENATRFGSGRPSGVTTVDGYGQSAYWDPATHQLNVLKENDWYILTRTSGGQPGDLNGTKALADKLF